jgi:hypothetical protein
VKHLGLIEARYLSTLQAKFIFIWSRIRSVADLSDEQETRFRHMFFEDFLEGLVRLSTMIALPTDMEIEEVGAADAGEFLLAMQADDPLSFQTFVEQRKPKHKDPDGSDFDEHAEQPIWRCVQHLISLLVRTVEQNTSGLRDEHATGVDGAVDKAEAAKFIRARSQARQLHLRAGGLAGTDFNQAMENAKAKAITTAAAIMIQMAHRAKRARARVAARKVEMKLTPRGAEGEQAPDGTDGAAAAAPPGD